MDSLSCVVALDPLVLFSPSRIRLLGFLGFAATSGVRGNFQCKASFSGCPISHHGSKLANPFLCLPLEFGKCESCGTSEPVQCYVMAILNIFNLLCRKCPKRKKTGK